MAETSGCRDEVVIVTKGGHPDLTNWQPRLTPEDVEQDLTESLDRLGVDCVDLYLLHRDNEKIPVDELVDMLASHAGAGRVKAVGVSNWTWQRAEEANQYRPSRVRPGSRPTASTTRSPRRRLLSHRAPSPCATTQLPSPGTASRACPCWPGRRRPKASFPAALRRPCTTARTSSRRITTKATGSAWSGSTRLARDRGWLASQVALAWLFNQSLDMFAVVGPTRLPHLNECMGAVDLPLTPSEVTWLNLGREEPDE